MYICVWLVYAYMHVHRSVSTQVWKSKVNIRTLPNSFFKRSLNQTQSSQIRMVSRASLPRKFQLLQLSSDLHKWTMAYAPHVCTHTPIKSNKQKFNANSYLYGKYIYQCCVAIYKISWVIISSQPSVALLTASVTVGSFLSFPILLGPIVPLHPGCFPCFSGGTWRVCEPWLALSVRATQKELLLL